MSNVLPKTMRAPSLGDRLLLSVSVIAAVAYLVGQTQPFAGSALVKSLAVSPLALIAARRLHDRSGLLLGAALFLSAVGDLLLGIDADRLFVFGLAAFLIAHVLYIVLFALNKNDPGPGALRIFIALLVTAYAASMLVWLWPSLGDLRSPVAAYICVIACMGVMSLLAGFRSWIVPIGALLFMLSDSLIAVSKFKSPFRYDNYLIWLTYYVGQVCIAMGFLRRSEQVATGAARAASTEI